VKSGIIKGNWTWWHMSIIPAQRMLRQEGHEFKASLDYIVKPCRIKQNKITATTTTTTIKKKTKNK
jgi:hypothetical protein